MRRIFFLTGLICMLQGCIKETSWNAEDGSTRKLVVDAIITDQVKTQQVKLSYQVAQLNLPSIPAPGATVLISNEDSAWQLTEYPSNSGVYNTPPYFFAQPGQNYTLLISMDGVVYTAKSAMNEGSLFGELRYAWNEENNLYYVDWVANAFGTGQAAMWELLIDWSMVPGYEHLDSLDTHARMLFYTLPTLDVSEVFAPVMESLYFPAGTMISERRYSLTTQHAEFIREMLLETNWAGGLFSVASANVVTNLSGGAFGYFGACAITELSVIVVP
jgi:hypothetical protein